MSVITEYLSKQLEDINYEEIWLGSNLMDKIEAITEQTAFIRPIPDIHSVAEIIGHLTAWNIEIANSIRKLQDKQMVYKPESWRSNNELKTLGWERIKKTYQSSILAISILIRDKDDAFLEQTYFDNDHKKEYPYRFVLEGLIHHIPYHLGQIGITIKLLIKKELHV